MSYKMTLEKAGAEILTFKEFGSYQGDWYAKVAYQGETGWITGCYGSCSGTDSFQTEFGNSEEKCEEHEDADDDNACAKCPACLRAAAALSKRYADFGRTYLDTLLPQEKQEELLAKQIKEHTENDGSAEELGEILTFVIANR